MSKPLTKILGVLVLIFGIVLIKFFFKQSESDEVFTEAVSTEQVDEVKRDAPSVVVKGDVEVNLEEFKQKPPELVAKSDKLKAVVTKIDPPVQVDGSQKSVDCEAIRAQYQCPVEKHQLHLSFDDGVSNVTDKVLDILKRENIKATFFVIGLSLIHI